MRRCQAQSAWMLDCRGHLTAALHRKLYEDRFPLTDHSAPLKINSNQHAFSYASQSLISEQLHCTPPCGCLQKAKTVCPGSITDLLLELQITCSTKLGTCLHCKFSYKTKGQVMVPWKHTTRAGTELSFPAFKHLYLQWGSLHIVFAPSILLKKLISTFCQQNRVGPNSK